jgi:opacity protein-like surface antigen
MRSVLFPLLTLSLLAIFSQPLCAAENDQVAGAETQKKPPTVSLFLGDFDADDNPGQLQREGSGYGWGLTAGYFFNQHLSVEGEFLFFRREYQLVSDSVLPGTASNNQRYLTLGLSALAKASHRFGRWRPFVGVGAGYYDTDLFVTDPESGLFTTDGAPASVNSIGYQVSLGVSAFVRKNLQLEAGWKTILLDGDFGAHSNGKVDLGGNLIYLAVRAGGF